MSDIVSIFQCEKCRRYVADGEVHSFLAPSSAEYEAFKAANYPQGDCGRPDCDEQVGRNKADEVAKTARRIEFRRMRAAHGSRRGTASPPARECRMPYKDEGERFESAEPGTVTAAELSQHEFESSGAADAQNKVLIEFFTDPKTHGRMFPMTYLEEMSGAKRMNNRAIDLRRHFEPLGFGVWNEMKPFGPTGAMHSHYGLFPLAEVERKKQERDAERERKRAEREGQKTF